MYFRLSLLNVKYDVWLIPGAVFCDYKRCVVCCLLLHPNTCCDFVTMMCLVMISGGKWDERDE